MFCDRHEFHFGVFSRWPWLDAVCSAVYIKKNYVNDFATLPLPCAQMQYPGALLKIVCILCLPSNLRMHILIISTV